MCGQYCKKPLNNSFGLAITINIGTHIALMSEKLAPQNELPLLMLSLCVMLTIIYILMKIIHFQVLPLNPRRTYTAKVNVLD